MQKLFQSGNILLCNMNKHSLTYVDALKYTRETKLQKFLSMHELQRIYKFIQYYFIDFFLVPGFHFIWKKIYSLLKGDITYYNLICSLTYRIFQKMKYSF